MMSMLLILLLSFTLQFNWIESAPDGQEKRYKIAIIGGGISGTFTAKYLAEYDVHHRDAKRSDCFIDEIAVFDVSPPPEEDNVNPQEVKSSSDPRPQHWQGSRVSSLTLQDGSVIELGASIIYSGNQLVVDMMAGDPEYLVKGKPMGLGKKSTDAQVVTSKTDDTTTNQPSGFGIYHGNQEWLLRPGLFSSYPQVLQSILKPLYFLWRYNFDYFRLNSAVKQAIHSFDVVYALLNDTDKDVTYFENPMDMWAAIGLKSLAGITFHEFLDELGISRDDSLELSSTDSNKEDSSWWNWRRWLPGIGCLRSELVTAMTINTYNQDLNEMNGLVGLVAYVPAGGDLFSVEGGNDKLMKSAIKQARNMYETSNCKATSDKVQRHQATVTTVISSEESIQLLSDDGSLGEFDIVLLAAPLQMCRIKFLMHSPMGLDPSILHEMPLAGVHDNIDAEDIEHSARSATGAANNEHGARSFANPLLPSATTPYTSVVTTIISNVTLNSTHFGIGAKEQWPRSILVSERGKSMEGLTTLTILSVKKRLVKTFSTEALDTATLNNLFGPHHNVVYVQMWGGGKSSEFSKYGGATPSFRGGRHSESLPYLLYDGAMHWGKNNAGPALYYVNAIESAVAAIEISAIGAKSTAKLVARRLGLISPSVDISAREEL